MSKGTAGSNIFLKIINREIPARIVYEDARYIAFHDVNPQAPVHVLIVPCAEVIETLNDLTEAQAELVGGMILLAAKLAAQLGIAESGYRTVFNCNEGAGQTVWHIHLHLLGGRPLTWPPG